MSPGMRYLVYPVCSIFNAVDRSVLTLEIYDNSIRSVKTIYKIYVHGRTKENVNDLYRGVRNICIGAALLANPIIRFIYMLIYIINECYVAYKDYISLTHNRTITFEQAPSSYLINIL